MDQKCHRRYYFDPYTQCDLCGYQSAEFPCSRGSIDQTLRLRWISDWRSSAIGGGRRPIPTLTMVPADVQNGYIRLGMPRSTKSMMSKKSEGATLHRTSQPLIVSDTGRLSTNAGRLSKQAWTCFGTTIVVALYRAMGWVILPHPWMASHRTRSVDTGAGHCQCWLCLFLVSSEATSVKLGIL